VEGVKRRKVSERRRRELGKEGQRAIGGMHPRVFQLSCRGGEKHERRKVYRDKKISEVRDDKK